MPVRLLYITSIFLILALPLVSCSNDSKEPPITHKDESYLSGEDYIIKGVELSSAEADALERKLESAPEDIDARAQLLGYYLLRQYTDASAAKARAEHILWFIENRPEMRLNNSPIISLDPISNGDAYYKAKQLWLKNIKEDGQNANILANAASFMLIHDKDISEDLYFKLQGLEPNNPEWHRLLGHLYMLTAMRPMGESPNPDVSGRALSEMEVAASMVDEEQRFYMLGDMAKLAFDTGDTVKASEYANEVLDISSKYKDNWNYGNATHEGNTTLGRVAARNGDINIAAYYLIESGKTGGSPQLDSFGPSMELASDIIKAGETESVITYLELCKNFWEGKENILDAWINEIKATGPTKFVEEY